MQSRDRSLRHHLKLFPCPYKFADKLLLNHMVPTSIDTPYSETERRFISEILCLAALAEMRCRGPSSLCNLIHEISVTVRAEAVSLRDPVQSAYSSCIHADADRFLFTVH